jgi:hypothetical protein
LVIGILNDVPPQQFPVIVNCTNERIEEEVNLTPVTKGELIWFFDTIILITKFKCANRALLWSTVPCSKYKKAPLFGTKTRFPRKIQWHHEKHLAWLSTKRKISRHDPFAMQMGVGWQVCKAIHHQETLDPLDPICVDESISWWNGIGGNWINLGLPKYVRGNWPQAREWMWNPKQCLRHVNPGHHAFLSLSCEEQGREWHNTGRRQQSENKGTRVCESPILPWATTSSTFCGDFYFALVNCCLALKAIALNFTGAAVVHTDNWGVPDKIAFVELDWEQGYSIFSSSSMQWWRATRTIVCHGSM